MSYCGKNHGRSRLPQEDCPKCQAKLAWYQHLSLPGTAVDTETLDDLVEYERREKFFLNYAGSLRLCGSRAIRDDTSPGFENAVRVLEDQESF